MAYECSFCVSLFSVDVGGMVSTEREGDKGCTFVTEILQFRFLISISVFRRIIGTLHNSDDFARVFKCPSKSFMNPSTKCSVW